MSDLKPGFYKIENAVNGFISDDNKLDELNPVFKSAGDPGIFSITRAADNKTWLIVSVGTMEGYAQIAREATEKDDLIWDRIPGGIKRQTWDISGSYDSYKICKPDTNSYWILPSPEPRTQVADSTESTNDIALWKFIHVEPYTTQALYTAKPLESGQYYINGPVDARPNVYGGLEYVIVSTPTLLNITRISGLVYTITPLENLDEKPEKQVEPMNWLIHPLPTPDIFMIFLDGHVNGIGPDHWCVDSNKSGTKVSVLHEHTMNTGILGSTTVLHPRPPRTDDTTKYFNTFGCFWQITSTKP